MVVEAVLAGAFESAAAGGSDAVAADFVFVVGCHIPCARRQEVIVRAGMPAAGRRSGRLELSAGRSWSCGGGREQR